MKQYESFVISQGNVQGLRSSAFGLKSNELFNEFKGRGRGREGHLHQMAALEWHRERPQGWNPYLV